jgi:hypothetical protein
VSVITQLYFQIVEEINYMFRPFTGWAIIRLKLEQFENTVVLRRSHTHSISFSAGSHNGDDATKDMFLSLHDEVTNALCVSFLLHDTYQYNSLIVTKQT